MKIVNKDFVVVIAVIDYAYIVVVVSDYFCMLPANITAHFDMFNCPVIDESKSTKFEETKVIKSSDEGKM